MNLKIPDTPNWVDDQCGWDLPGGDPLAFNKQIYKSYPSHFNMWSSKTSN